MLQGRRNSSKVQQLRCDNLFTPHPVTIIHARSDPPQVIALSCMDFVICCGIFPPRRPPDFLKLGWGGMGSGRIRVKLCIVANKSVMYDSWPVMSWPVMTRHGPAWPVMARHDPSRPVTARRARRARHSPSGPSCPSWPVAARRSPSQDSRVLWEFIPRDYCFSCFYDFMLVINC